MTSSSGFEGQLALQTDQGTQSDLWTCDLPCLKNQLTAFSCGKLTVKGYLKPVRERYGWKTRKAGSRIKLQRAQSLGRGLGKSIYKEGIRDNSALPPLQSKEKSANPGKKAAFQVKSSLISPLAAYSRKHLSYSSWRPQENRPAFRLRRRAFLEVSGVSL